MNIGDKYLWCYIFVVCTNYSQSVVHAHFISGISSKEDSGKNNVCVIMW